MAGPDTNQKGLIRNLNIRNKPGCRNHEMVEMRTLRRGNKANSKTHLGLLEGKICPEICLEEFHGIWPWREEESRKGSGCLKLIMVHDMDLWRGKPAHPTFHSKVTGLVYVPQERKTGK